MVAGLKKEREQLYAQVGRPRLPPAPPCPSSAAPGSPRRRARACCAGLMRRARTAPRGRSKRTR